MLRNPNMVLFNTNLKGTRKNYQGFKVTVIFNAFYTVYVKVNAT